MQPKEYKWSPLYSSRLFLDRVSKVPVTIVELENVGHYSLEEPRLGQMSGEKIALSL